MKSSKIKTFSEKEQIYDWTVLSYVEERGNGRNSYWLCQCKCGNQKIVQGSSLRKGQSRQCKHCSGKINGKKGVYKKDQDKAHLYFVQVKDTFKIGVSKNPLRRIKDIQSDCPYKVETLYIGLDEGYEEELWHTIFAHRHLHGEWFSGFCEVT